MAATVNMIRTTADGPDQGKRSLHGVVPHARHAALGALALAFALGTNAAAEPIRRCIGSNGEPVFSDQPCGTLAPLDRSVTSGIQPTIGSYTCAVSAGELRDRVADAFAARNALAFSGLLLWDGYRRGEATPLLQELARLVVEPLLAIDIENDGGRDSHLYDRYREVVPRPTWSLVIRTARDVDRVPHEAQTRFTLADHGGCWWLQPGY